MHANWGVEDQMPSARYVTCKGILMGQGKEERQRCLAPFDLEFQFSFRILDGIPRRNFIEYHAKNHAGYNAAWKYHCAYGLGSETEPSNEIHPAFR